MLPMTPIVIAGGVPLAVMVMVMVMAFLAAMVMVMVGARLPKAGDHSAQETDTRCSTGGWRGYLTIDPIGLPAHRDQLFQLAPVQPHPFTSGADVDRDAKALDFFHSFVTDGTLHRALSQFDWHSVRDSDRNWHWRNRH
jgi:hypothetical protein